MLTWIDPEPIEVPPELREAVGGHPLAAEILARRGLREPQRALAFLDPRSYSPSPAESFPGMDSACTRIEKAIAAGERIWVWGDFDVDGQTSTALLVSALRALGAEPGFHIPVRKDESHGVNIPYLEKIIEQGADLMLTCDTGITAHEALSYAQEKGLEVIVSDHHALGGDLPPALAWITPRLLPAGHALEGLPGVGAAYKLAEALLRRAGKAERAEELLDLVALGIVADVALQTGDTRYLLQRGLDVLRRTERAGLRAMFELADLNPAFLTEEHIGFSLGPRLNALGRLADANPAVELLTTRDPARARVLALELEALNARRQLLTRQILESALAQIERDPKLLEPAALILAHPEWPAGVIGIVASQLAERYHRPVLLLSNPPGENARGSARSIEGVDITACIATQAGLLSGYGGHPMAAGLSLPGENLAALRRGLDHAIQEAIRASGGLPPQTLAIDAFLDLGAADLDLVSDLERLAPFGPGNPALVFAARGVSLASSSTIGRAGEHKQMMVSDASGQTRRVLWWGGAGWPQPPEGERFDLAYSLRASNFRGQREVQIEWIDFRLIETPAGEARSVQPELVDRRGAPHPRPLLEALKKEAGVQVWAEGEAREPAGGEERSRLVPGGTLVVWSTPPGRGELQAALERVRPARVVVFGLDPAPNTAEAFLQRLAAMANFALRSGEAASGIRLERLAGACAQREGAVRKGLAYLEARGQIAGLRIDGDVARFEKGGGQESGDAAGLLGQVRALLRETSEYRRYFASAPLAALF